MSTLQEDKNKLFNSQSYRGPVKELTIEGVELEVRCPRVRHTIKNLSNSSQKIQIQTEADLRQLILDCVYHKASGQPFFDETDLEQLEEASGHEDGILATVSNAIIELTQETMDADEKELVKN